MAGLLKQTLDISFAQGLDTKSDPNRVMPGKFLVLQNSVFDKVGELQKANGFGQIASLPTNTGALNVSTFSSNLMALGVTTLNSYSSGTNLWTNKGTLQPLSLSVVPGVRSNSNQNSCDSVVAPNGLSTIVWADSNGSNYYQIIDTNTNEIVVSATALPATAVTTSPRVFLIGAYFLVCFYATISAVEHLRYVAIPYINPTAPSAGQDLSNSVSSTGIWDGSTAIPNANGQNTRFFYSWAAGGSTTKINYIDLSSIQANTAASPPVVSLSSAVPIDISVTIDRKPTGQVLDVNPVVWVTYYNSTPTMKTQAYTQLLAQVLAPTTVIAPGTTLVHMTSTAYAGNLNVYYETSNVYSGSSTRSDFLSTISVTQAGVVGAASVLLRSVGLASKAVYYIANSKSYMLAEYGGALQPTYFLIDSSGNVLGKLAYSNGGPLYSGGVVLPNLNLIGTTFNVSYLFQDLIVPVNKTQQAASPVPNIYGQTGINLAIFNLNPSQIVSADLGHNLHLTGGYVTMYDGVKPVEHQFHVYPEDLQVTTANSGGHLKDQIYYYIAVYEWTDAQGNIHRSAPSVPITITTSGGNVSVNTVKVPYLRLTAKTGINNVRIVIYRWSTAQQIYYQITSMTSPQTNVTTSDLLSYSDSVADATILGNNIIYTNGGVVEDIAAPASNCLAAIRNRVFLIDAEDPNLLWYSKQVIEATPVEFSDLFTIYIPPTVGAQGNTGPSLCLAPMDEKIIIFKKSAIYYFTGEGPDNTGASNDFSQATYVTSSVGCSNQNSIVLMPNGLMFQSDKGIWLLGRDLSTSYIGAPVEAFNSNTVTSALCVPGTNQVRFTMNNGYILVYDYFFQQWNSIYSPVAALSSTIYNSLQTYVTSTGSVYQETPNQYMINGSPLTMKFQTGWMSLAGVQGYERAYWFTFLGKYLSPHRLKVEIAYDYDPSIRQTTIINPNPVNYTGPYGSDNLYGGSSPYGGANAKEQWRVYFQKQKCEAFQLTVTEIYDPTYGVPNGAGLTMSGINLVYGQKRGFRPVRAAVSAG